MSRIHIIILLWIVCLMGACSPSGRHSASKDDALSSDSIHYAKGFSIKHYKDYIQVDVNDPWDSTRLLQRYLLVDRAKDIPSDIPKGTVVRTPIRNIVVYTSVHAAIIDQLRESDKIIGVCEPRYIDVEAIQKGLKEGTIVDMGEATSPNVEKMIEKGVETVIVSPFQNSSYGPVEKLGFPIIEGADYMESSPLGRTEWVRFYGLLFNKEQLADSIFHATEGRYKELSSLITDSINRPSVIAEKKFGSSWFVSGSESYTANLYKDAGANYIFKNLPGGGSTPLSFETVFDKGIHSDVWLIKYNQEKDMTYSELAAEYQPYSNFDAFKKRNIYGCNTGAVPFYEEFPLHPDYLLADLIWVFHPELMPGYTPRYYKKMAEAVEKNSAP